MNRLKKILFSAGLIILALVLLEAVLRLTGSLYLHSKAIARPAHTKKHEFRILCLGDSFTQGFGAPSGSSYPEQLQKLLAERGYGKVAVYKEFRVNSSTVLKYLPEDMDLYDPDLIVIMVGCNDRWNMENTTDDAFGDNDLLRRADILLSRSRVYKLLRISFLNSKAFLLRSGQKKSGKQNIAHFKVPEARKHIDMGGQYFSKGEYAQAFRQYALAEQLEPLNAWVHFHKAFIYAQIMKEPVPSQREIQLMLQYGGSAMVEYAFMFMDQLYNQYPAKMLEIKKEMDKMIDFQSSQSEKEKSRKILKRLLSLSGEQSILGKVIKYNLEESVKLIKKRGLKVIFMHYPEGIASYAREATERTAVLYEAPVIDNGELFREKLSTLSREDLFVRDGHCSARGYGLIAENLYNTLIQKGMLNDAPHA